MTYFPRPDDLSFGPAGELVTAQKNLIFHYLPHINDGESLFRIRDTETNSATFTPSDSEWTFTTTADAADVVSILGHDNPRFYPGMLGEIGWTVRSPETFTGDQLAEWGQLSFDGSTGIGWGVNASGLYVWVMSNSVKTTVAVSSFSNDSLDGTGPSGLTWDNTAQTRFTIEFPGGNWQGNTEFYAYITDANDKVHKVLAHRGIPVTGAIDMPSTGCRAYFILDNGTAATARNIYAAEMWAATAGNVANQNVRAISQFRFNITPGTTPLPAVSFRKKTGFEDTPIWVHGFDLSLSDDCLIYLRQNATLTAPSWGAPNSTSATETAVEQDIVATGTNSGTARFIGVYGAGSHTISLDSLGVPRVYLYDTDPMSLYIRTLTGTATRIDSLLRIVEEW